MPRRASDGRGRGGFTLVEVLIALIVLVVGVLGILAMFPAGMRSDKDSTEDTYAAMICESVVEALRVGMQNPAGTNITLVHDLDDGTATGTYTFTLPVPGPAVRHPANTDRVFRLGRTTSVVTNLNDVKNNDPTDPLAGFAFSFHVQDATNDLYEYRIIVFRRGAVGSGASTDTYVNWAGVDQYRVIHQFRVQLRLRK